MIKTPLLATSKACLFIMEKIISLNEDQGIEKLPSQIPNEPKTCQEFRNVTS